MSARQLLPPEFDLPAETRLEQRRLLETAVGRGAARSAFLAPRAIALAAALALGVLLANPAFGLRQRVVEVFASESSTPPSGTRDAAGKARSDRVSAPDQPVVERAAPPRQVAKARRSPPPRGSGTGAGAPDEPAAPVASERRCRAGSREARIAGARRCLRVGERCERTLDRQYHRYGFDCHGGRLAAAPRSADLSVTSRVSEPSVQVGYEFTHWLAVRNRGPGPAAGVVVRASLPPGAIAPVVTAERGECTTGPTEVTCTVGRIARAGTVTVRIVGRAPITPRLVSTATVSARTPDPRSANNGAAATTLVRRGFVRGRGLVSYPGGPTIEVVADAVGAVGPGGETGQGTFSYRSRGPWDIAISGRVTCLSVTEDGRVASVTGVVDVANYGASSRELDPVWDIVSVGQEARLVFLDASQARGGLDALDFSWSGGPPRRTCPSTPPVISAHGAGKDVLTEGDFAMGFSTP